MRKGGDCRSHRLGAAQFLDARQARGQLDVVTAVEERQDRVAGGGILEFCQADSRGLDHRGIAVGQGRDQRGGRFRAVEIGERLRGLLPDTRILVGNCAGQIRDHRRIGTFGKVDHRHDASAGRRIIQPLGKIGNVVEVFEKRAQGRPHFSK